LPLAAETPDAPRLYPESVVRVDDISCYVSGAIQGDLSTLGSLVAVSPEGSRTELAGHLFGRAWPHVASPSPSGFAAYFSLPAPSYLSEGWRLEMRGAGVDACEAPLPLVQDLAAARKAILDHLVDGPLDNRVMEDHVFPALSRMQAQRRSDATIDRVVQLGRAVEPTRATIVVALDQSITMLEHQLAQFAADADFQQVDLIYVLDVQSPDENAIEAAAHLHELYRVPFRLVTLAHPAGFAGATDISVPLARGRLVLLLGPHVLPERPGWITALADFHDAHERIGAVGAKLLGPSAARKKSKSRTRDARVQAVRASCLMIDRSCLERAGGFSGKYVQRDFEAADLCLRLEEAGHEIWSCGGVEMYDLELRRANRTSRAAQIYDDWLLTKTWRA
jgi:hypothetical protein